MAVLALQIYVAMAGVVVLAHLGFAFGMPWGGFFVATTERVPSGSRSRVIACIGAAVVIWSAAALAGAVGAPWQWPVWTGWAASAVTWGLAGLSWIAPGEGERLLWGWFLTIMSALSLVILSYSA